MQVLFDQGTPVPLRRYLSNHQVATTYERGWSTLRNGELLTKAEEAGYDVFVTTDRNLRYQQNLTGRRIAIIVITTTSWPRIQKVVGTISRAVDAVETGTHVETQCHESLVLSGPWGMFDC